MRWRTTKSPSVRPASSSLKASSLPPEARDGVSEDRRIARHVCALGIEATDVVIERIERAVEIAIMVRERALVRAHPEVHVSDRSGERARVTDLAELLAALQLATRGDERTLEVT